MGTGGTEALQAARAQLIHLPTPPLAQVVRFDVPAGQELCIVGDLHGQFEVRASGLLLSHCYTLLRAATHALPPRALRMRVSATTGP